MTALMLLLVAAFVLAIIGAFAPNQYTTNLAVVCVVVYLLLHGHA